MKDLNSKHFDHLSSFPSPGHMAKIQVLFVHGQCSIIH